MYKYIIISVNSDLMVHFLLNAHLIKYMLVCLSSILTSRWSRGTRMTDPFGPYTPMLSPGPHDAGDTNLISDKGVHSQAIEKLESIHNLISNSQSHSQMLGLQRVPIPHANDRSSKQRITSRHRGSNLRPPACQSVTLTIQPSATASFILGFEYWKIMCLKCI